MKRLTLSVHFLLSHHHFSKTSKFLIKEKDSHVISDEFTFLPNHVSYSYFWLLSELHLLLVLVAQVLVAVCSEGVGRAHQKRPWRKL